MIEARNLNSRNVSFDGSLGVLGKRATQDGARAWLAHVNTIATREAELLGALSLGGFSIHSPLTSFAF
jgi:hypothetical protein